MSFKNPSVLCQRVSNAQNVEVDKKDIERNYMNQLASDIRKF